MALNGNTLGTEICAAIEGVTGGEILGTQSEDIWKAIGGAIVKHIQSNGEVNTVVTTPDTINGTGVGGMT